MCRQPIEVGAEWFSVGTRESQVDEIRRTAGQPSRLRQDENTEAGVGRNVEHRVLGKLLRTIEAQYPCAKSRSANRRTVGVAVHDRDGPVVVGEQGMHGLVRRLGAEVSARRQQVPIEQVPVDGRPRVVEHPLDHARGRILIPAIRLEHRTLTFVRHELRRDGVILRARWRAIACRERRIESVEQLRELPACSMEEPDTVRRPHDVGRRHHATDALDGGNGGARTGLGVVGPRAAMGAVL